MPCSFHVELRSDCPAFRPFLEFFLNMDTINPHAVSCLVDAHAWTFYCQNPAHSMHTVMRCPRESFSAYSFREELPDQAAKRARTSAGAAASADALPPPPPPPRTDVCVTFFSTPQAMRVYRAVLKQSEICACTFSYAWEAETDAKGDAGVRGTQSPATDVVDVTATRNEKDVLATKLWLSGEDPEEYVDIEGMLESHRASYTTSVRLLPTAALSQSLQLLRSCLFQPNAECQLVVRPHPDPPTALTMTLFRGSTDELLRNFSVPLNLSDAAERAIAATAPAKQAFPVGVRMLSVLHSFCHIAPRVSLFLKDSALPCFVKFTTEEAAPADPYMYIVFAWNIDCEEEEEEESAGE